MIGPLDLYLASQGRESHVRGRDGVERAAYPSSRHQNNLHCNVRNTILTFEIPRRSYQPGGLKRKTLRGGALVSGYFVPEGVLIA